MAANDGYVLCAIIFCGSLIFLATIIVPATAIHFANEYKVKELAPYL